MADSLGSATRANGERRPQKQAHNGDENDTPSLREARIQMYMQRADNRCDIFTGKPIGNAFTEDEEE